MAIQHEGWSVVAQYRRCGKTGCKACAEGPGHGPYYYGTRTVGGKRRSKYFGKRPPGERADAADVDALEALRTENAQLRAEVQELRVKLAAYEVPDKPVAETQEIPHPSAPSRPHAPVVVDTELTRQQVEDIWQTESAALGEVDAEVLQSAHDSFMRGLFRKPQDNRTRLRTGRGIRPYVCPFRASGRGAHRTFGDPTRLVTTAVPWLIETTMRQTQDRQQTRQRMDDKQMELRRSFEQMPTEKLRDIRQRMRLSLNAGSRLGWNITLEEIEERERLIAQVLEARG